MGSGLPADCGRINMGFPTPFHSIFIICIENQTRDVIVQKHHRITPMVFWKVIEKEMVVRFREIWYDK